MAIAVVAYKLLNQAGAADLRIGSPGGDWAMLYRRSQHDFEATVRKTQKGRPTILDRILEAVRKENPPTSWVVLISENGKTTAVIGAFSEERLANDYRLDLIGLDLVGLECSVTALHNPD